VIQGWPKNLPFVRGHDSAGVLQAVFDHAAPMGAGLLEGFYSVLHREAGEEFERHVWGHFASTGLQSFWTLCLTADEVEDNHQIAKKLRRLKAALDKMFTGTSWLPEGTAEFMATVSSEAVRFHEAVVFAGGERSDDPVRMPGLEALTFVTDGYGPSSALLQAARALGLPENTIEGAAGGAPEILPDQPYSQADDVHFDGPQAF
jgi:hypothetical protein